MKANPAFPILSRPAPTMRTFRHFIAILAISLTIGRPGAAADSLFHHRPILTEGTRGRTTSSNLTSMGRRSGSSATRLRRI